MEYKKVVFKIVYPVEIINFEDEENKEFKHNEIISSDITINKNYYFINNFSEEDITRDCKKYEKMFSVGDFVASCGWFYADEEPLIV